MSRRPRPPVELREPADDFSGQFLPAPELLEWTLAVFLDPGSKLYSPTHEDLRQARIGFLWTNHENVRRGKLVLGDASLAHPPRSLYAWDKAASSEQLEAWFSAWWDGEPADFRIRGGAVQRLVDAASKPPRARSSAIATACGSCLRRVA